ncbi:unnamed protein product [Rotaria sp. Silwood1]|nr:unnamed protein product [Rotaria sp. Silwood1]
MYTLPSDAFVKNVDVYHLPGITPETIETCSDLLQKNHEKNHVFFNLRGGFHNHTAHHLLTALSLGASSNTLKHIYEQQMKIQLPLAPLHKEQDFDVQKCLGDDNYYHDYLEFFKKELNNEKYQGNIEDLIEDYVFNHDYLGLIFAGAYHPFIHLGYAVEFQSKLMAIEGLAMASVDRTILKDIVNHFNDDSNKDGDKTALDIIELIVKDSRFDEKVFYTDARPKTRIFLQRGGAPLIVEYARMWKCDLNDARRAAILINTAAIRPKKAPRLDFFLMHSTTSSLFLDIMVHSLKKKENQLKLIRAKFAVDLFYYVARGRPKLNLNYLCNEYPVSKEHLYIDASNPWLPLIDKCLTHPDEHVTKTIRALIYADKFDNAQGQDKLPYLKIAQMVMDALFPAGKKDWAQEGIGWDEYWQTVPYVSPQDPKQDCPAESQIVLQTFIPLTLNLSFLFKAIKAQRIIKSNVEDSELSFIKTQSLLALHCSLIYLDCYNDTKIKIIEDVMENYQWSSFQLNFTDMGCNVDNYQAYLNTRASQSSSLVLENIVHDLEAAITARGIRIKQSKGGNFHMTLATVKYQYPSDCIVSQLKQKFIPLSNYFGSKKVCCFWTKKIRWMDN